jgi:hypothetical protein
MDKFKIKDYASNALYTVLVAVLLWVAVSSMIHTNTAIFTYTEVFCVRLAALQLTV